MRTIFTFCFLLFAFLLSAQEISFSYSKKKILLGEQLDIDIEALLSAADSTNVFFIDTLPHFEVLERLSPDTIVTGNKLLITQTIVVTSWDSGSWMLPAKIIHGVPSNFVKIDVGYTSPWDPKQPYHDVKGIVPVKNPGRSTWWWYVIGAAVLIALFLLFFPEGKKENTISELDTNAYKKAMQQLNKLQSDNIASVNGKQYYTELINIFRSYLKGAKGIQSFSKTTDDLSIQLKSLKMPQEEYNELVQTLRLSDLVKFAQYKPEGKINHDAFNTIKSGITTIENRNAV